MRKELSILIPMYNADPRPTVKELCRQAQTIRGLDYELIVIDDGSTDTALVAQCWEISQWTNCRFMALEENIAYFSLFRWMGGAGSMMRWQEVGLAGTDGVHFTRAGARKAGNAVAEWILNGMD